MFPDRIHQTLGLVLLLFAFDTQKSFAKVIKINLRPVHEPPSDHIRSGVESKKLFEPHGNPLLGDSSQRAKTYLQNQQAMFNAEKLRQLRAQQLRYQAPMQTDSYMKAYQDSHEKHHSILEHQAELLKRPRQAKPGIQTEDINIKINLNPLKVPESYSYGRYASQARQQFLKSYHTNRLPQVTLRPENQRYVSKPPESNAESVSSSIVGLNKQNLQTLSEYYADKLKAQKNQLLQIEPSLTNSFKFSSEDAKFKESRYGTPQTNAEQLAAHNNVPNSDSLRVLVQNENDLRDQFKPSQPVNNLVKETKQFVTPEPLRFTKDDAMQEKHRNNRSPSASLSEEYLENGRKFLFGSTTNLIEGVTIKPNGNLGLTATQIASTPVPFSTQLYTEAIPSNTQVIYPKQYNQMQAYQSAHDIGHGLIQPELYTHVNAEPIKNEFDSQQPIDILFYLKDASSFKNYGYSPTTGSPEYHVEIPKDHTPIKEEIVDIPMPAKPFKIKPYKLQTVIAEPSKENHESKEMTSNNYYKVEVATQVVSSAKPYEENGPDLDQGQKIEQNGLAVLGTGLEPSYNHGYQFGYQPAYTYFTHLSKPLNEPIEDHLQSVEPLKGDYIDHSTLEEDLNSVSNEIIIDKVICSNKSINCNSNLNFNDVIQVKNARVVHKRDTKLKNFMDIFNKNQSFQPLGQLRKKRCTQNSERRSDDLSNIDTSPFDFSPVRNTTFLVNQNHIESKPTKLNDFIAVNINATDKSSTNHPTAEALRGRFIPDFYQNYNKGIDPIPSLIGEVLDYPSQESLPLNPHFYDKLRPIDDIDEPFNDENDYYDDYEDDQTLYEDDQTLDYSAYAPSMAYTHNNHLSKKYLANQKKIKMPQAHFNSYPDSYSSYRSSYYPNIYPITPTAVPTVLPATALIVKEPYYILSESQLRKLTGHHNINVANLGFYHIGKGKKTKGRGRHRGGAFKHNRSHHKRPPTKVFNKFNKIQHLIN